MSPQDKRKKLAALLSGDRCVIAGSVFDPLSARIADEVGFEVGLLGGSVASFAVLGAPDLMLVDIEMPRMDGFDLTRNVRGNEATKAIPIIMITSRTADKHRNVALGLGVNAYFGKPYQETVLLAAIEGLLGREAA